VSSPSGPPITPFPKPPLEPCIERPVDAKPTVVQHLAQNWRSTVSGLLTLVVITGGYFAAVPATLLQQHGVTQNQIFWGTVISGLAKLYIAIITKDTK
jgi:hypothetical protein